MKHAESAGSLDGFPSRFSAACLKTGEEKSGWKDAKNDQLAASLALISGSLKKGNAGKTANLASPQSGGILPHAFLTFRLNAQSPLVV